MFMRIVIAIGAICLPALPVLAQTPKPTVIITAKPISRLLSEYREMIRQVGGPSAGDNLVMAFDDKLKEQLGENGFEGVDINRPIAAYTVVKERFEDTNPILLVPINGEKEIIGFLKSMKMEASAVKDKKGLYMLRVRGLDFLPNDSFMQIVDGWAYIGLNGDDVGDAKNRLPIENLFSDADQSLFTVKLFPGQFPEKLLKEWLATMDMAVIGIGAFAGMGGPPEVQKMVQTFFDQGPKLLRRYAETGIKEVEEVRVQFSWEANTGDTLTELTLIPKAGSMLAKDIAARAATTHRFSGLTHAHAAIAVSANLPLFAKELREIIATVPGAMEAGLKSTNLPEQFQPLVEEVVKALTESIKKGDMDISFALVGPDKNGKFTLAMAVSMADTAAIEKTLRQTAKAGEFEKEFEFDVVKAAGISIHKVPIARAVHEELHLDMSKLFGEKPLAYVAFAKDAAFVTFGPDSLAVMKTAVASKTGPAPVLEVSANANSFHKLIAAVGTEKEATEFARLFGTEDKQVSLLRVYVEGGQTLKAKATLNLRYIPRLSLLD